jgi:hypothetical protein
MNAQQASLFRINYKLQRDDHLARAEELTRRPFGHTLGIAVAYALLLLLLLLLGSGSVEAAADRLLRLPGSPELLQIAPYLLPALLLLVPMSTYGRLLGGLAYRRSGLDGAEIILDITSEGIDAQVSGRSSRTTWATVRRLIETPEHLFIQLSRREALIIPRRAVEAGRYEDLVGFIRARTGLSTRPRGGR